MLRLHPPHSQDIHFVLLHVINLKAVLLGLVIHDESGGERKGEVDGVVGLRPQLVEWCVAPKLLHVDKHDSVSK